MLNIDFQIFEHSVQKQLVHLLPHTVSYNRLVELMQAITLPMSIFLKTCYQVLNHRN